MSVVSLEGTNEAWFVFPTGDESLREILNASFVILRVNAALVADGRDRDSVRGDLSENVTDAGERHEFDHVAPELVLEFLQSEDDLGETSQEPTGQRNLAVCPVLLGNQATGRRPGEYPERRRATRPANRTNAPRESFRRCRRSRLQADFVGQRTSRCEMFPPSRASEFAISTRQHVTHEV